MMLSAIHKVVACTVVVFYTVLLQCTGSQANQTLSMTPPMTMKIVRNFHDFVPVSLAAIKSQAKN